MKKLREQRQEKDDSLAEAILAEVAAYEEDTGFRVVSIRLTAGDKQAKRKLLLQVR